MRHQFPAEFIQEDTQRSGYVHYQGENVKPLIE